MDDLSGAVEAVREGELVVYPTETVYGLGADALDPAAVERVFEAKLRDRNDPISFAVADVETALRHVEPAPVTRAFMAAFLPGPVTVLCPPLDTIPANLTGGAPLVGVRVPDHPVARDLAATAGPITATSANRSGEPPVRRLAELDPAIRRSAAVCLDGGVTDGGISTVVDPAAGVVYRRGRGVESIERWLTDRRP